jgi:ferric-dicitrate binding protein FerR (iron transport regulator)
LFAEERAALRDPVYSAIERHRQAYNVFMDVWDRTRGAMDLYECAKTDKTVAAELRRFSELEKAAESAFLALLAIRPTTKAGAIACVEHVADCGLATDEMRAWLRCSSNRRSSTNKIHNGGTCNDNHNPPRRSWCPG